MARRPANEARIKREVEAFIRQEDALIAHDDVGARLDRVDFPVFMVTDDPHGAPEASLTSRDRYLAQMKPFWDTMPKDTKVAHRLNVIPLSDTLAVVVDDYSMAMGHKRVVARDAGLVVKQGGQWRWKVMAEAGWGGMEKSEPPRDGPRDAPPPGPGPGAPPPPTGSPEPHRGAPPPAPRH